MQFKVLDVNMSRSPELKAFLAQGNVAVVTDLFLAECFKGDDWRTIFKRNTEILLQHPRNVAFCKPLSEQIMSINICGLSYDPRDLLDEDGTMQFLQCAEYVDRVLMRKWSPRCGSGTRNCGTQEGTFARRKTFSSRCRRTSTVSSTTIFLASRR